MSEQKVKKLVKCLGHFWSKPDKNGFVECAWCGTVTSDPTSHQGETWKQRRFK